MIILASQSPRRQELMKLTGLPFTVRAADVDETMDPALPVSQEVARVVAADTVVVIDGAELGKPHDAQDAARMLRLLSGRTHEVVTVMTVCRGEAVRTETVVTKVTFRDLSETEIDAYIRTGEPMDKAGSYGIQGYGAMFVERIEGDYFAVMGLPLCPLCRMLRAFGVPVLDETEAAV